MRETLRRLPLERAVGAVIVVTIVDVACGSNWSPDVRAVAGPLRWVLLAILAGLAVAWAFSVGARPRSAAYGFGAALLAAAAASTLWSVDPRLTLGRCVAFGTLLVAAAAVALAAAERREAVEGVLGAVLAGAVLVALAGLAILAVSPGDAVQEATSSTAARYRGLGQNPNTVVMLLAVAMPIAVSTLLRLRRRRARAAAVVALLLFAGSIVASGSRAALLAGFVAALVPALVALRGRRARLLASGVAAAALGAALALTTIGGPDPSYAKSASSSTIPCTKNDAQCYLRLEDELGRPPGGRFEKPRGRSVLGSSGRLDAWGSALEQGGKRPTAGFGFGTESRAFTDRLYAFQGGVPENSFVGIFLQLGAAGLALLVALVASLLLAAVRALRATEPESRALAGACGAVLLVGLGLALFQSYLYAAGNTATLSVWIGAFLVTAIAARRTEPT